MKRKGFGLLVTGLIVFFLLLLPVTLFAGGGKEEVQETAAPAGPTKIRLGVFIPGALGDSPPYDAIANVAKRVSLRDDRLELVNVFEAGFDQSKWPEQLLSFAASGRYDVIYTSNEALGPAIVDVAKQVPNVKFIITDSYVAGNDQIFTTFPNKWQQGYFYGYMMALISQSSMKGANPEKMIGLVFGQHYVMMDDLIIPSMEAGAKAVDPGFELKTVMLGNWYDAKKAESLALNLISLGVDCMGSIAGSGNAGVIRASVNKGTYICLFEPGGFDKAPGTVVGAVGVNYEDIVQGDIDDLIEGNIPWGKPRVVGAEKGYITVPLKASGWVRVVPEDVRVKFEKLYNDVINGVVTMPVPQAVLDKINAAAMGQ